MKKKKIFIIGSTGHIGRLTLEIISQYREEFEIVGLVAHSDEKALLKQAENFKPTATYLLQTDLEKVQQALEQTEIDIIVLANSSSLGTRLLISASHQPNRRILVANKESIIMLGSFLYEIINKNNNELIPLDSEHNSLFQVLRCQPTKLPLLVHHNDIKNLTITASGGSFWQKDISELDGITPDMAVKHPNWQMGAKISVDSSTLANKVLEMMELKILFGVPAHKIRAVIHPQSIIHSMVAMKDGNVFLSAYQPDMRVPISNGLFYPHRKPTTTSQDFSRLDFFEIDESRFPIMALARSLLEIEKDSFVYFNIINEILVSAFLQGKISFLDITNNLIKILENIDFTDISSLEEVFLVEQKASKLAYNYLDKL